jgi:hypothetical protein
MELSTIISIVTFIVTFSLGLISKKSTYVKNHLIPLQNLCIGIIASIIYYIITKDINLTIVAVGIGTGGVYDVLHNIQKLIEGDE